MNKRRAEIADFITTAMADGQNADNGAIPNQNADNGVFPNQNAPQNSVNNARAIPWAEAPDYMDLACIVTIVSIWKCWRTPAAFGLLGILSGSLCWEQRALGRSATAEVGVRTSGGQYSV